MGLITRRSQVQILAPLRPTHRPRETPTYTIPARLPTDFEVCLAKIPSASTDVMVALDAR
jgi:hypothetical protein